MSEPILLIARRWKCPHCSRSRSSRQATAGHIGRCWQNPENRTCRTCVSYDPPGDGSWCEPSRPCSCNNEPGSCLAGLDVPGDGTPVTGCPLWAARKAA